MEDLEKQAESRKKAIFDSMSSRSQQRILKKGYEKWNPFEEPKDPIDIRRDSTNRTTQQLVREFLQTSARENYSNAMGGGFWKWPWESSMMTIDLLECTSSPNGTWTSCVRKRILSEPPG